MSAQVLLKSEKDVRDWVKKCTNRKARWVEPSVGSTVGLPDCWIPMGVGRPQVHVELKHGKVTETGRVKFTVRPSQKTEIKKMIADGVPVLFFVSINLTKIILMMTVNDDVLSGVVEQDPDNGYRMVWGYDDDEFYDKLNVLYQSVRSGYES